MRVLIPYALISIVCAAVVLLIAGGLGVLRSLEDFINALYLATIGVAIALRIYYSISSKKILLPKSRAPWHSSRKALQGSPRGRSTLSWTGSARRSSISPRNWMLPERSATAPVRPLP